MRISHYSLILFLLLNLSVKSKAQELDFTGIITTSDSVKYSYRLYINIDKQNINGYSITDYLGLNETRTQIVGTISADHKKLSFRETTLNYSKTYDTSILCYIHGDATILKSKGKNILYGVFKGKYPNNTICARGSIYMVETSSLVANKKEMNKVLKSRKTLPANSNTTTPNYEDLINSKSTSLSNKDSITFVWESNKLVMKIWDQGFEDGDIINLRFNGILILNNFKLTKEIKEVNLKLHPGIQNIEIEAINTGRDFPNTASILLIDNKNTFRLTSYLNTGEKSSILIKS